MINPLAEIMPGMEAMVNIHPLIVHFPIALLFGYVLADSLALIIRRESLVQAASWMLYLGTLGAAATVATGLLAADTVDHDEEVHGIMETHETIGLVVLTVAFTLALWRWWAGGRFSPLARAIHLGAGLGLLSLVTLGADLGGMMVYGHGVGVTHSGGAPVVELSAASPEAADAKGSANGQAAEAVPMGSPVPATPTVEAAGKHHTHSHTHKHKHTH